MSLVAVPHPPLSTGAVHPFKSLGILLPGFQCLSFSSDGARFWSVLSYDRGVGKDLLFTVDRGLLVFTQSHVDLFSQASLSIVTQLGRKSVFRDGQAFAKEIGEKDARLTNNQYSISPRNAVKNRRTTHTPLGYRAEQGPMCREASRGCQGSAEGDSTPKLGFVLLEESCGELHLEPRRRNSTLRVSVFSGEDHIVECNYSIRLSVFRIVCGILASPRRQFLVHHGHGTPTHDTPPGDPLSPEAA